ncbi:hypothetical protein J8Z24_21605 (plasmid) [Pseudoalteromonas sp. SCSIO 43201]|uniref:hypothetical protein n=1 Tax=Pseudoalteromonas sp. SCSIO 43201 TaxID=2822842 RepID=UPI002074B762|nr:hypothetical protein [Pseudoalteromonas sp. SCSIO 43201]USD31108.1 hypothetical protein J8Z24_21605 [Pseudoalteromonas sp. SCSIO 43201]
MYKSDYLNTSSMLTSLAGQHATLKVNNHNNVFPISTIKRDSQSQLDSSLQHTNVTYTRALKGLIQERFLKDYEALLFNILTAFNGAPNIVNTRYKVALVTNHEQHLSEFMCDQHDLASSAIILLYKDNAQGNIVPIAKWLPENDLQNHFLKKVAQTFIRHYQPSVGKKGQAIVRNCLAFNIGL